MDSERLKRGFDAWEARTRGESVRPYRVPIEPTYRPLLGRQRVRRGIVDDARIPGFFEQFRQRKEKRQRERAGPQELAVPVPYEGSGETVELQMLVRADYTASPAATVAFIRSLGAVSHHLSFEILGDGKQVVIQIVCDELDRLAVRSSIRSHLPDIRVLERRDYLWERWHEADGSGVVASLGLTERSFRMLRTAGKEIDPFVELVGCLDRLDEGQLGLIQVLFAPLRSPWDKDLEEFASSIQDVDGVLSMIRAKFAEPAFAAVLRVAAVAPDEDGAFVIARRLARSLISVTRSEANELAILRSRTAFDLEAADMLARQTRRRGLILALPELLNLVHLPSALIRSERLLRQSTRTKPAPATVAIRGLVLGVNEHEGTDRPVALTPAERLRHIHVLGSSGSGKSTLLLSMAIQDIEAGNGFAVLDPHGDLIEDVIARIPEKRAKDVVFFDPADEEYPLAFNPLSAHSDLERTLLASDFVAVFRRLSSTTFGDQMVSVLGNAVLAMLESRNGGTLLDLRRFLTEKSFRTEFLKTVADDEIRYYWEREFPLLKATPQSAVLTRLNTFLRPKLLRYMVAQKDDRFNLREIMDSKKILLAKLSRGLIGEENSHLLGSLLVAKIAQATVSRQEAAAATREPFTLYIDEFHHFVTPSVADILSGARKYALGLCLAHHDMRQLRSKSDEVASAVLSHAYTRIVFQVSEQEARTLADGFSFFEAKDLQNQNLGEAIVRIARSDFDFNMRTILPAVVSDDVRDVRRGAVQKASRTAFSTPRYQVEAALKTNTPSDDSAPDSSGPRNSRPFKPALNSATEPTLPGRGGTPHRYLQQLVKKLAEDRGFTVSLEKVVLDGHGYVDAALERDGLRIACEISVTTRASHELGNLTKCLAAGFDYAVLLSSDDRLLKSVCDALPEVDDRMRFLNADGLMDFLDELPGREKPSERRRKEKVSKPAASANAGQVKRMLVAKDAAMHVGLAVQTLAKFRVTGEGPPFHKLGSRVVYDPKDLDAWLQQRRQRSTSDDQI